MNPRVNPKKEKEKEEVKEESGKEKKEFYFSLGCLDMHLTISQIHRLFEWKEP